MHDKGHLTTMVDLEMYVENDKKDPLTGGIDINGN